MADQEVGGDGACIQRQPATGIGTVVSLRRVISFSRCDRFRRQLRSPAHGTHTVHGRGSESRVVGREKWEGSQCQSVCLFLLRRCTLSLQPQQQRQLQQQKGVRM